MKRAFDETIRDTTGAALIEVIVSIMILAVVLVGLATSTATASRSTSASASDLDIWAELQLVADSLTKEGGGNVAEGNRSGTFPMSWKVSTNDANTLDQVDLAYQYQVRGATMKDTLTLLLTR